MAHKLVSHVIKNQRFFVYKINDISFRERMFCIFDTEQPYELTLNYKELTKSLEVAPIIGGKEVEVFFFKNKLIMKKNTNLGLKLQKSVKKYRRC
jgi:hypothetical protein